MKKLKIVFFVTTFPSVSETFILNQIIELIKGGHSVKILSRHPGFFKTVHKAVYDYDLIRHTTYVPKPPRSFIGKVFQSIYLFISQPYLFLILSKGYWLAHKRNVRCKIGSVDLYVASWILKAGGIDIFHAHFGINAQVVANLKVMGLLPATKLVTTFHGADLSPDRVERYKKEYQLLLTYSNAITVNTEYLRSILHLVDQDLTHVFTLPVGLNTSLYVRSKVSSTNKTSFNLLFCGRLIALKGPDLAVEIVHELVNKRGIKNIRLSMVGSGEMKEYIEAMIVKYDLTQGAYQKQFLFSFQ